MKAWFTLAIGLAAASSLLAVGQSYARSNAARDLSAADKKFVMEAAAGGMMEVKLGEVAAQRGANAAVKEFGQRMVRDHSKANDELTKLAADKGITLPKEP